MNIPTILMFSKEDKEHYMATAQELGFDFLQKPISMEELGLVWQYIYNKADDTNYPNARKLSGKENDIGGLESGKMKEKEGYSHNATNKKKRSRIVWNSKLHRKFIEALTKLGNKKSSPKIILKMMNEPTLTLRQVASHLQKYKSQIKQLNMKASIEEGGAAAARDDESNSVTRIQLQQFLAKQKYNTISTYSFHFHPPPQLLLTNVLNFDLTMLNNHHNHPVPCGTIKPVVHHYQNPPLMGFTGEQLNPDLTTGIVQIPAADYLDQNAPFKELDDLLNNSGDDSMPYCSSFDAELNLVDIDSYYQSQTFQAHCD